jgi:hypothetical protein
VIVEGAEHQHKHYNRPSRQTPDKLAEHARPDGITSWDLWEMDVISHTST